MANNKKGSKHKNSGKTANRPRVGNPQIEECFKSSADLLARVKGKQSLEYFNLDSKSLNRRMRAVQACSDKVAGEFDAKYPEINSVEEKLIWMEALPIEGIDEANEAHNIYLGAALWILDELKKTGKIYDIYPVLPRDLDLLINVNLPLDFGDVGYDEDLIRAVMVVLAARDGEPEDGNFDRLLTGKKKSRKTSWREQYDAIIGALESERIEQACQNFKEYQKDFLDRYFKCANSYYKKVNRIQREIDGIEKKMQSQMTAPTLMSRRASALPGSGDRGGTGVPGFAGWVQSAKENDTLVKLAGLELSLQTAMDDKYRFEFNAGRYCHMTPQQIMQEGNSQETAEIMTDFQPEDPYEVCFAFLYMLDKEDEDVWLHNTSLAVTHAAGSMLPWSVKKAELWEQGDEDTFEIDALTFNYTNWLPGDNQDPVDLYHTWVNGEDFGLEECDSINLAQLIYKLSRGVAPRKMHPFRETRKKNTAGDPDVERAVDLAEMLFLSTFESPFESFEEEYDWLENTDDTDPPGEEEEAADAGASEDLTEQGELPADAGQLATENRRLRDEIKQLKNALYETSRSVKAEKKQLEQERVIAGQEHRELADLRELIFNQQEGKYEEDTVSDQITFPYNTQHQTVVFGGHDSWAREIKPKLPDVRFVDANAAPNADLIRNAAVVWIQPNCIGHSNYYKILDEVRKHKIPLRYFTYASAIKCAEQLAMADR